MSKVISAGKAVMIGSFVSKGISIVSSVVLARLLFEEDYGALVLSSIFAGLITQIGGMGYELFYLQHKGDEEERRKVLEQVYNLRLLTNFLMFIVQAVIGFYFFIFTENRTTGGILIMMAVSLMLEGFNAPQETLLKDKMEFNKITIGNIFKELLATIGKVVAAFLGFGGYAFGMGPVLGSLVRMFYLRSVQPYRHAYFLWDKNKIIEIFNFSKHVLFGSVSMYLVQQVDRIFLTLFFPQNIVGRYGFAWGNASLPFNYLVSPQQQVIMTLITRFKVGEKELFSKLKKLSRLISLISYPVYGFALIFTEEVIAILFSDKWMNSVDLIRIISLYYLFVTVNSSFSPLLTCLGKPKFVSIITFFKALFLALFLIAVIYHFPNNIVAFSSVFCVVSIFFDSIKSLLGIKFTGLNFSEIFMNLKFDILCFFVLFAFVLSDFQLKIISFLLIQIVFTLIFFVLDRKNTIEAIKILNFKKFKVTKRLID